MAPKPAGYWDIKEHCLEEAKKYSTRIALKNGNNTVYNKLCKKGWLQEAFENTPMQLKPVGYWTKERCAEEALKYEHRCDFEKYSKSAYVRAVKEKWIFEICEHMTRIGNKHMRCVYVYEFPDNSAYIGLTYNIEQRQIDRDQNKNDQVTKHKNNTGFEPIRKQLTDYINADEAAKLEIYYIDKYKEDGWNVLNVAPGGSLGGGEPKWTYDNCKNTLLKYKYIEDFANENRKMYNSIKRKNWVDLLNLIESKPSEIKIQKEKLEREQQKEKIEIKNVDLNYINHILELASNFYDIELFKKTYNDEYRYVSHYRKFKDLINVINNRRDTITIDEIKVMTINYKSPTQILRQNRPLYNLIKYRKIESEVLQHTDQYKYNGEPKWSKERCIEAAIGCKNRREYSKKFPGAYWMAKKEGWIDEILIRTNKPASHYTKEICFEHSKNYTNRKQFCDNDKNYYEYSRKNGWLDEFFPIKHVNKYK